MNCDKMKINVLFLMVMVIFLLFDCKSLEPLTITIAHKKSLKASSSNTMLAGVSRVNITPPPGLPMAGHSSNGKYSKGVRTKLYARIIYLKPSKGKPVVLIQCDLLGGSRIVHHKVAELISGKTDVEPGGLVIAATHTHSGYGNYFTSMFYNKFASRGRGFDPRGFEFLTNKLASGVIDAYNKRRPAKLATGTINILHVLKNRSLPAYHMNKNLKFKKPHIYEATNPTLHMIRIDCMDEKGIYKPAGAFSNFSMHPNLSNDHLDHVYNADFAAYAERYVEWGIKKYYDTDDLPVHAIANYTDGDMTPLLRKDIKPCFREIKRVGTVIGKEALSLFISLENKLKSNVKIQYRAKEIDVFKEKNIDSVTICNTPGIGMALVAGASGRGRETPLFHSLPPFSAGHPKKHYGNSCQKEKRILGGALQKKILPTNEFPHILFLQIIQIDNSMLMPLPFEITVEAGKRIESHCKNIATRHDFSDVKHFIPMSVSNGYWGYVTTPEEYSLQYYEGGHNLYGPSTNEYLSAQIGKIMIELKNNGSGTNLPELWHFFMQARTFYPPELQPAGKRKIKSSPRFHKASHKKIHKEDYWSFKWIDVPPCLIDLDKPLIIIESSKDKLHWQGHIIKGEPVDDTGDQIAIICKKKKISKNMALYEVRWYNPGYGKMKYFRIKILSRYSEGDFYSPIFTAQ